MPESQVGRLLLRVTNSSQAILGTRGFGAFLLRHKLDTESRLILGKPQSSIAFPHSLPEQYIHLLQVNENMRSEISKEVRIAFNKDLIIHWAGGAQVWFHVGDEPIRDTTQDRVSGQYLEELMKLPRLESEGDGIRSFVGILLACMCGGQPLFLVDEPEAFLHPPQIRRIAGILAKNAEAVGRQVIIATHSGDVVRGALESSDRVSICRMTRAGNLNYVCKLGSNDIKELLSKPLLRSATAIEGVFHEGVVVCEGDADCRIYEALAKRLESNEVLPSPVDFHFIHGGGKGALATLATVYMKLRVPVVVIADLDLLRNKEEFKNALCSLGGDFSAIEGLYNSIVSALSAVPPIVSLDDFLEASERILGELRTLRELKVKAANGNRARAT